MVKGREPGVLQSIGSQSQARLSNQIRESPLSLCNLAQHLLLFLLSCLPLPSHVLSLTSHFLPFVMEFLSFYAFSGSYRMDFPGGSDGKVSAYSAGDPGSVPGSGRSPGEGNDNPLQYSCLENPMDGEAW